MGFNDGQMLKTLCFSIGFGLVKMEVVFWDGIIYVVFCQL